MYDGMKKDCHELWKSNAICEVKYLGAFFIYLAINSKHSCDKYKDVDIIVTHEEKKASQFFV